VDNPGPCDLTFDLLRFLRVDTVRSPTPAVTGTVLRVRGESFIPETSCVTPQVTLAGSVGGGYPAEVALSPTVLSANELEAAIPPGAIAALGGPGTFNGVLRVRFVPVAGGGTFQAELGITLELAEVLIPTISRVAQDVVYLNDEVGLDGTGFIDGNEGSTDVIIAGVLTRPDGTTVRATDVRVRAGLVTAEDRTRVTFPWTPRIGGIVPGTFEGTVTPWNTHASTGATMTGPPITVRMTQQETVLFAIDPTTVSLGQIASITGRGFIGAPADEPAEGEGSTRIRLHGEFYPCNGTPIRCSFEPVKVNKEIGGDFLSGSEIRYPVTVTNADGALKAVDFNAPRGRFVGTVTPVLYLGTEQRDGMSVPGMELTLGPIQQVCWVRFLPGFADSLDYFGLGAVDNEIRRRVIVRMQEIYRPPDRPDAHVNVEFRDVEPTDFYPGGYAILDIGGPDPNGMGLFGYDNTVGKDVMNLRLWDHVGGENALGALDGHAYGGVFIESFLFFSNHPPFGDRPSGAPPPHPRFDQIFDPVREDEVVAGEYPSGASPERTAEIEAAIAALANLISDTSAHEFGHSLGLAQPYVPEGAFHSAVPGEGCLMDAGGDRPFEERAMIDGNPGARFCQEDLWYLLDILPMN
jgi:hypothetical protein